MMEASDVIQYLCWGSGLRRRSAELRHVTDASDMIQCLYGGLWIEEEVC